jgi:DNA-binding SARP family transcriptional activator/tetratricopeptide (TPR) repeat protein
VTGPLDYRERVGVDRADDVVDEPDGALTFQVLGPLAVHRGPGELPVTAPRERAVMAALVRGAGAVVHRDQLIADVWGDDVPPSAVATLHSYLAQLRRRLEPAPGSGTFSVVERTGTGYRLNVEPGAVDAVELEHRTDAARRAWAGGRIAESATELRVATGLWRGRPYPELCDSPVIAGEVARLENLWLTAVEDRVRAELALGDHERLVGELESLVTRHPFRETLWAHLIVALYRVGRQAEALRAFGRLRTLLVEELGIEPGPPLRRLELAVLRHDRTLDPGHPDPLAGAAAEGTAPAPAAAAVRPRRPVPAPDRHADLVGRQAELGVLASAWSRARNGGPVIALVGGEPGAGASRLVDAFADRARREGAVLSTRCRQDLDGLGTARALTRQLVAGLSDVEVLRAAGPFAPALATLAPDVAARVGAESSSLPRPTGSVVIEAVAHLVEHVALTTPVAAVLDDGDRIDRATATLARHLLDRPGAAVLIVITHHERGPLSVGELAELARHPGARRLTLDGLDGPAVARLWADRGGDPLDPAAAVHVRGHTAGNPRLVGELAAAGWAPGDAVPDAVLDEVGARLARLPPAAAAVVELAAVAGRGVPAPQTGSGVPAPPAGPGIAVRVLAGAAGTPLDELVPTIDALVAGGLLDEVPGRSGLLRFHHPVVHDAVYARLSASRRALLHDRLAAYLSAVDTDPDVIAHHALRAIGIGDTPRAVSTSIAAARAALDELAVGPAVGLLNDALTAVEGEPGTAAARAELLAELAHAQRAAGEVEAATASAVEAAAAARGLGRADILGRAALATVGADRAGGLDPRGVGQFTEALAGLGDGHDELRAQLLGHLAVYRAVAEGDQRAAEELIAEAEVLARRAAMRAATGGAATGPTTDPALLAVVLAQALLVLRYSHRIDQAEVVRDELTALVRAPRSLWGWWAQAMLLRHRPVLRLVRGDAGAFAQDLDALERTARGWAVSGAPDEVSTQASLGAIADLLRATWALGAGDLDDAGAALQRLGAVAGEDVHLRAGHSSVVFLLLRELGRLDEVIPAMEALATDHPRAPFTLVCLAYCHLWAGDRDTARRLFARAAPGPGLRDPNAEPGLGDRNAAPGRRDPNAEPGLRDPNAAPGRRGGDIETDAGTDSVVSAALLAEIAAGLGDRTATAGLRRTLEPYGGQLLVVSIGAGCLGAADRYLGLLAALDGRTDEAERRYERALDLETAAGLHLLAARTGCHLAEHLQATGRPTDATRVLAGIRPERCSPSIERRLARLRPGPGRLPLP